MCNEIMVRTFKIVLRFGIHVEVRKRVHKKLMIYVKVIISYYIEYCVDKQKFHS